jgi:galactose mutarotase-like enzyme
MFHVGPHPERPALLLLSSDDGAAAVTLAPARGGMAATLRLHGQEVFFMDWSSFDDPSKNVRGGNPVLFPSPGKLTDDRWAWSGRAGAMKQHGFARNLPWALVHSAAADDGAAATLLLRATPETLAQYPWAFEARYTYALTPDRLRIEQVITNQSDAPMPFGLGFHPYFQLPDADKARAQIQTAATRAFDNAARAEIAFTGFDLTAAELDYHLLDHGATSARLTLPGGARPIDLLASEDFTHWVVWTLRGRDFACVEPWSCPGDALNTNDRLILLPPGATHAAWVEIALAPSGRGSHAPSGRGYHPGHLPHAPSGRGSHPGHLPHLR